MKKIKNKIVLSFFISLITLSVFGQERELVSGGVVQKDQLIDTAITERIRLQSPIFKDTMGLSRMSAISIVVPGFSQLYNKQYWKIPVLYGTAGGLTYLYTDANKKYKKYKRMYNEFMNMENATRENIDPVQTRMINYNTQRQVYMIGAALTYLYFLGDGVINYPHPTTPAKRATTLAMIFPGAGQIYNKSYWKVPIVIGAFATMGYVVDFNNRGYNRFKTAYNEKMDENAVDEFGGRYPAETLKNMRDSYRRNRDLSIILTCALYLLTVVEAHVDAYMKDYDISDDLSLRIEPTLIDMSPKGGITANNSFSGVGLAMRINF